VLLILAAVSSRPAFSSPGEDFDTGVQLFNQGDYEQALTYFTRAETGGMASAQLIYNLGSVYYKLAQFENSRRYFEILVDDKNLGAQAYYNLGLIEHKLGDDKAAIALFEKSRAATTDEGFGLLAQKQIAKLRSSEAKPWFGYATAGYGYDSNITAQPSSSVSDESSAFLETLGLLGWKISGSDTEGIHSLASYYSRNYSQGGDFDNDSITLGGEIRKRIDLWDFAYGLQLTRSSYSDQDFLANTGFIVRAKTRLQNKTEVRLQLLYEDISERSDEFFYLDGNRTRLNAGYRVKTGMTEYRYEYEFELNDRANTPTTSHSPTRHEFGVQYLNKLSNQILVGGALEYRYSDYERVASQDRVDDRIRVKLKGERKVDAVWRIKAELLYADNRSSENEFEYHKYEANVSLHALF
jgi:Tfp pilus assembly protein PilF